MSVPSIKKLDEIVINRIAAGEVVQRPSAAIKELLENALDAGSTNIVVTIKAGGMQLIQIQDNGHGIRREDLSIVCERFTTSKLRSYDDLKSISTFGFRGEALASITHVSHVTILTKTAESPCAFRAKYNDGKLVPLKIGERSDPKPCAGTTGTTISVEDLFFNMPTRKVAFKNVNDEYQRILDVVSKYSIHYSDQNHSFTCKKANQNLPDLHIPQNSTILDSIRLIYGSSIANELIDCTCSYQYQTTDINMINNDQNEQYTVTINGKVTNANYSHKKSVVILFINDRLIECLALKQVIDGVYRNVLPKHQHPFVYLSIKIPPQHVDVNVHPTKKEVHFLHEDKLLENLHLALSKVLINANESRIFSVGTSFTIPMFEVVDQNEDNYEKPIVQDKFHRNENNESYSQSSDTQISVQNVDNDSNNQVNNDIECQIDTFEQVIDQNVPPPQFLNHEMATITNQSQSISNKRKSSSVEKTQVYANKLNRVDSSLVRIDTIFRPSHSSSVNQQIVEPLTVDETLQSTTEDNNLYPVNESDQSLYCQDISSFAGQTIMTHKYLESNTENCVCCNYNEIPNTSINEIDASMHIIEDVSNSNEVVDKLHSTINESIYDFYSLQILRSNLLEQRDSHVEKILRKHTLVGVVNSCYSLIQYNTQLLLIDHHTLSKQLFYQLCIQNFGQMDSLKLPESIDIKEYVLYGLALHAEDIDQRYLSFVPTELAEMIRNVLVEKRFLLGEYFKIIIDTNGMLTGLPLLIRGYHPDPLGLPLFLLKLVCNTNWDIELECFKNVSQCIADYYATLPITEETDNASSERIEQSSNKSNQLPLLSLVGKEYLTNIIFPYFKTHLIPLIDNDSIIVTTVTALENLYKVFERC